MGIWPLTLQVEVGSNLEICTLLVLDLLIPVGGLSAGSQLFVHT